MMRRSSSLSSNSRLQNVGPSRSNRNRSQNHCRHHRARHHPNHGRSSLPHSQTKSRSWNANQYLVHMEAALCRWYQLNVWETDAALSRHDKGGQCLLVHHTGRISLQSDWRAARLQPSWRPSRPCSWNRTWTMYRLPRPCNGRARSARCKPNRGRRQRQRRGTRTLLQILQATTLVGSAREQERKLMMSAL